jgi:DNA repair exonuclease SbcCD ATPase subunit
MRNYKELCVKARSKFEYIQKQKTDSESKYDSFIVFQKTIEIGQAFIQKVAKETQEKIRFHIQDIVQLSLDYCFPEDNYKFDVSFDIERGKTVANLSFKKNGKEIDPLGSSGGGLNDVVSFALRLAVWSLGKTERIIILDEPFKWLSKDLHSKAGELLRKLSDELKLQIIMTTHLSALEEYADKVFKIELIDDVSIVR